MHLQQSVPTNMTIEEWLKAFQQQLKTSLSSDMMECIINLFNGILSFLTLLNIHEFFLLKRGRRRSQVYNLYKV